jgi:hypothetical protein
MVKFGGYRRVWRECDTALAIYSQIVVCRHVRFRHEDLGLSPNLNRNIGMKTEKCILDAF